MSVLGKATYRSLSVVTGLLGGVVAGAVFTRVWRAVSDTGQAPEPTELDRGTREVLVAAALQGAVFGLVKAALDRVVAQGYRRLTGADPRR